jgi:transposase
VEDPQRFASSREVGPDLGLVPKQEDSGDSQPQLGISKAGDRMLRRLLVGSSQYMLEPSDRTATYDDTGCDCVNGEERMPKSEPWWR